MDQYIANGETTERDPQAGPVFIPQEPPRKLGVLRTIVLLLMIFVAAAEVLLLGGVYLMASYPGILPG